jgi:Kef-type K+ transport system membrane component KefB
MTITQLAAGPTNWIDALRQTDVEQVVLVVLVQLIVIILAARLFAAVLRPLKQPTVVGEIVAGLILGPSVFGRLFPEAWEAIFHPGLAGLAPELADELLRWFFTGLSQLGLIFLLFLIGLEFDFRHVRWHGKSAVGIAIVGIAVPFGLGLFLAPLLTPYLERTVPTVGFALFLGTALSITAIPVLGRIMMELNITRTRLGVITISAAAVDDAVGWILLAAVTAMVRAEFDPAKVGIMLVETVAFTAAMIVLVRPVLRRWAGFAVRRGDGELSVNALAILLAVIMGCALVTNLIGIFSVFGAFILGAVLSPEDKFCQALSRRLRDFVTAFFLPVFFAYTGLRTDIGSLETWQLWLLCGLVAAAGIVGKFGGCGLAAWRSGFSARESACIGVMMNTRGLMALIVINLGKDLGVLPDSVFCMLVLMALLTTVLTTPALLWLMKGTELEEPIRRSGFVRTAGALDSGKDLAEQNETGQPMVTGSVARGGKL